MRDAILEKNIYCDKPYPDPDAHSGSWVRKGLGDQDLWSTPEYDPVTTISIYSLTHPVMCKMGFSSFAAMSCLKVVSTTSASLPITPPPKNDRQDNAQGYEPIGEYWRELDLL